MMHIFLKRGGGGGGGDWKNNNNPETILLICFKVYEQSLTRLQHTAAAAAAVPITRLGDSSSAGGQPVSIFLFFLQLLATTGRAAQVNRDVWPQP